VSVDAGRKALPADEHAVLAYLAATADTGHVSLRGMLAADRAGLPREDFDQADWERWTELYFAVDRLLAHGLVTGVAVGIGEHPNRFQITDAGRVALAEGRNDG
jgi:hypothetical protein